MSSDPVVAARKHWTWNCHANNPPLTYNGKTNHKSRSCSYMKKVADCIAFSYADSRETFKLHKMQAQNW